MSKLYQVMFSVQSCEYYSSSVIFNSFSLKKSIKFAKNHMKEHFLLNSIYDLSEFKSFDKVAFSNLKNLQSYESKNIYIVEVEMDSYVPSISFYGNDDIISWKIDFEVVKDFFIETIKYQYKTNGLYITTENAYVLFLNLIRNPKNYPEFNNILDVDSDSEDNALHEYYFQLFEKNVN